MKATKKEVILEKNQYYYGQAPKASTLTFYSQNMDQAIRDVTVGESHALFAYSDLPSKSLYSQNIKIIPLKMTATGILFFMNHGQGKSKQYRKAVAGMFRKQRLRDLCYPEGNMAERIIPPGLRGSIPASQLAARKEIHLPLPAALPILYTTSMESRCLFERLQEDYGRSGGKLHEFTSLEELYKHFQQGNVDFAFERLTFKSLDPSTVLQYFNPMSAEYFLKEEVPELTILFQKLSQVENASQKSSALSLIDEFLVDNSFVVPLQHETFHTAISENLLGFSSSDFGSIAGIKWEELGLRKK